ncbi:MAG TPA: phosphotransferase, partial [Ardenticatenaceae bacterium]|nr:phosphotransferase [Ardenticatenaceae bacterium]
MAFFQELGHDVDVLLRPLLDYLAVATGEVASGWRDWRIETIHGGTNNRLYRTTNPFGSFVVKFTIRDSRNRAGREYNALLALQQVAPSIAPRPVFLDTDSYAQPVVVQTWLEGAVSTTP